MVKLPNWTKIEWAIFFVTMAIFIQLMYLAGRDDPAYHITCVPFGDKEVPSHFCFSISFLAFSRSCKISMLIIPPVFDFQRVPGFGVWVKGLGGQCKRVKM